MVKPVEVATAEIDSRRVDAGQCFRVAGRRRWMPLLLAVGVLTGLLVFASPWLTASLADGSQTALWSVSLSANAGLTPTPSGSVLTGDCTSVTNDGALLWSYLPSNHPWCQAEIADSNGNAYVVTADSTGTPEVAALTPSGAVRWTTATQGLPAWGGGALGADGSVYFGVGNGPTVKVLGFDEHTGNITFDHSFSDVLGLYAYADGLAVVDLVDPGFAIDYYSYSGTLLAQYHTAPAINNVGAANFAGGANGSVYVSGHQRCDGTDSVTVEKFTPAGLVWQQTDTGTTTCGLTVVGATPDGGVILGQTAPGPVRFTSFATTGAIRWTYTPVGPLGPALYTRGPVVDSNGVVALPYDVEAACSNNSSTTCSALRVDFVSQQSTSPTLPSLEWTDSAYQNSYGNFGDSKIAIDLSRVYVFRWVFVQSKGTVFSISAFAASGLGIDYRLSIQEAVEGAGTPGSPPAGPTGSTAQPGPTSSAGPPPDPRSPIVSSPPPSVSSAPSPCAPVHGSLSKRLLASLKCTAIQTKLEAECAVGVATIILPELKSIKALKTTKGLYDLRKVRGSVRPLAKLLNDINTFKFGPKAPAGFRTGAEVIAKLKGVKTAYGVVKLLVGLAKALSHADFSQVALDMDDFLGLKPCVQAVANALA